jgi:hypothetical protein
MSYCMEADLPRATTKIMIDMILIERCPSPGPKKLDPQGGRVERSAVATQPLKGGTEPTKKLAALVGLVPILHCGEISNVAFLY